MVPEAILLKRAAIRRREGKSIIGSIIGAHLSAPILVHVPIQGMKIGINYAVHEFGDFGNVNRIGLNATW